MPITLSGFADWFSELWGYEPFPWQCRLAEGIDWPTSISAPTGSGKTAVIDAWLWRRQQGLGPRRLWYVVDRRVLVDAAFDRARRLVEHSGAECEVIRLRGGVYEDRPPLALDSDAVICSTVDQFGSRLLFSGYGLGRSGRLMAAALAGGDALVALDEAHLSAHLEETVRSCQRYGATVQLTPMTATPLTPGPNPLGLSKADLNHPVLGQRVAARKLTALSKKPLVEEAKRLRRDGARSIAVWCNTVQEAVATAADLSDAGKTILLTGRQRLWDRDQLLANWGPQLESASAESPEIYVVSTQVLEVGIDWDFDGMVTQAASLNALKQRMGRLDRLGRRGESQAVIIKPPRKPPVYGEAAITTWKWLKEISSGDTVDFGLASQARWSSPEDCSMVRTPPPMLLQQHLDAWALTSVPPVSPVSPWLHEEPESQDCRLLWRDELEADPAEWIERVAALPPSVEETAAVGLGALQRDVTGPVLIWRGERDAVVGTASDARPGDTVVLPSSAGHGDLACLADDAPWDIAELVQPAVRVSSERFLNLDIYTCDLADLLANFDSEQRQRVGERPEVRAHTGGLVVSGRRALPRVRSASPVGLEEHCSRVSDLATVLADRLGLCSSDLGMAARWHDAGKLDPRFQAWLAGGIWNGEKPLAKSCQTWAQVRAARLTAGYPTGTRHELLSAALLHVSGRLEEAKDPTLVSHLVQCHHGWGRPLFPDQLDDSQAALCAEFDGVELNFNLGQRVDDENQWWELVDRYNHWGLALHAAVLMQSDWVASMEIDA